MMHAFKKPWVVPLFVVTLAFLAFSLPPYLSFDPANARLPLRAEWSFPLLVGHILFGTVALVTCCLQIWPWLRQRHPRVHRVSGRIYVLGGVLPSGVLGAVAAVTSLQGVAGRVGNTMLALLWLATTFAGWRAARRRDFATHRRWMIRSFALATSIVANRFWVVLWIVVLSPLTDTYYGGDQAAMIQAAAETSIWLSWVVNLVIAEWWLERGRSVKAEAVGAGVFAGGR